MPSPIDRYHSLGLYYFKMEEYNKAIECFKEVLTIDPDHLDSKNKIELLVKKLEEKENHLNIEKLIKGGKEQGYLTYKLIEKYLAEDILDASKVIDLYDILSESGIDLVETEEEGNSLVKGKGMEKKDEKIYPPKKRLDLEVKLAISKRIRIRRFRKNVLERNRADKFINC